jgi:hypothetical protein
MSKPKYRRTRRPDDAEAFLDDVSMSHAPVDDDDAEVLGEEFVLLATAGELGENDDEST